MTYKPNFGGCWSKIDRAKEHLDTLEGEIDTAFGVETNRIALDLKYDLESGYHVFGAAALPPENLLLRWGLILGDVLQNLRAALDHLVWQLALFHRKGRQPRKPTDISFPIRRMPDATSSFPEDFLKDGALREIAPRHRALIEGFQPYNRWHIDRSRKALFSDDNMFRLKVLSNEDKHRVVTPVLWVSELPDIDFLDRAFRDVGGSIVHWDPSKSATILEPNAEVVRVEVTPPSLQRNMKVAGYITPSVGLPDGQGSAVYLAIDVREIAACVIRVISKFEPLF